MRIPYLMCLTLTGLSLLVWSKTGIATPQPAPSGGPIEALAIHDPDSTTPIRHSRWQQILGAIVGNERAGRRDINYGELSQSGLDVLDSYLRIMESVKVTSLNRDQQLAYWLNFYNAASVKLVYDAFDNLAARQGSAAGRNPLRPPSLKVKRIYLGDENPWAKKRFQIDGQSLSLNDIEHRILYAYWDADHVMYGLSCPARGCPSLPSEPFKGHRVHEQLRAAAQEFIARKDGVKVKGSKAELSELYDWHSAQFGGEAGILEHVRSLAGTAQAGSLAQVNTIKDYDFSWRLNGKQPPLDYKLPQGTMSRGVSPTSTF